METAMEFMKLEKVELGGVKGKMLSQQVVQVFEEFNEQFKVFTERSYDALDPSGTVSNLHTSRPFHGNCISVILPSSSWQNDTESWRMTP